MPTSVFAVNEELSETNESFAYRPSKLPTLTAKQKKVRLEWAKERKMWKADDWKKIVFSDETAIQLVSDNLTTFVRRGKEEAIRQCHTKPHKQFTKKILFWGCIQATGTGPGVAMIGTLDSRKYLKILEEHIFPHSDEIVCFQQDNAPPHKTFNVLNSFKDAHIDVMNCPPYSPDLNPIENVWALLKSEVRKRPTSSLQELMDVTLDIWNNDVHIKEACKSVFDNMPERIQAVCKSKGGYTKY